LVLSHLFEQGANDNASGCAVSLEVASCLKALIDEGRLPRPRRSLRLFQGLEWQGMAAYLHAHQEQIPRTRAALCLDCLGQEETAAQVPLPIYGNPPDKPAFTDPLLAWITRQWLASHDEAFHWMPRPYAGGTDNIIAEDPFGIPCPYIGGAVRQWHTTADTMETLSRRTLTHAAVIAAAYCYFLASAGLEEAKLLVGLSEHYGRRAMVEEAARAAERGTDAAVASGAVGQELARSLERLQTVRPLASRDAQGALEEAITAAAGRLHRFARTLLRA
jgi:aminopeptidase YwaD